MPCQFFMSIAYLERILDISLLHRQNTIIFFIFSRTFFVERIVILGVFFCVEFLQLPKIFVITTQYQTCYIFVQFYDRQINQLSELGNLIQMPIFQDQNCKDKFQNLQIAQHQSRSIYLSYEGVNQVLIIITRHFENFRLFFSFQADFMKLKLDLKGIYWKFVFIISLLFKLLFPQCQIGVLQLFFIFYFFLQQIQCQLLQLPICLHELGMLFLFLFQQSHTIRQPLLDSWMELFVLIYFSVQLFYIFQFFAILSYCAIFFLQYLINYLLMLLVRKYWFLNRIFFFILYLYFLKFICLNFHKDSIKNTLISFQNRWQFIFQLAILSIVNNTHSNLLLFESAHSMFKDRRNNIVGIYRKLAFILRIQSIYSMK